MHGHSKSGNSLSLRLLAQPRDMKRQTEVAVGEPARISPVDAGVERPLWSVMIPTFNCAHYLRQTLESVLAQDPGRDQMQIGVVDDCSSDDPQKVVEELGRKERVEFYRKEKNEGAVRNFNTCIERSRGHLIHILHGDDYVERTFYNEFSSAFDACQQCAAIFSRALDVDEESELVGLSNFVSSLAKRSNDPQQLMMDNPIRTPTAVVRRQFYELHGGFNPSLVFVADWELWVRTIVHGGARMLNKPLAFYRVSNKSDTRRVSRTAEVQRDYFRLAKLWRTQGLACFDDMAFERMVVQFSLSQWRHYRAAGDDDAANANYLFWRDHCQWKERILVPLKDRLRQFRSMIRSEARIYA
jgi:glycosyltransferase involved in cell wall biosynthesis